MQILQWQSEAGFKFRSNKGEKMSQFAKQTAENMWTKEAKKKEEKETRREEPKDIRKGPYYEVSL